MPGTREIQEIEIILDDMDGGGSFEPPSGRDGGDDNDRDKRRKPEPPPSRRYQTAIGLALVSITIFFMALASAFLVRKTGTDWIPARLPSLIWLNTVLLLSSSATLELSRRRLAAGDAAGFRRFWRLTTALGVLFLVGQLAAWRQLVAQGVYVASNPASSFFYIFTAAHGIHLLAGVGALLYVLFRAFEKTNLSRALAAEITSYYWHFMDGLWVFLLALLYLGK
jgi:cytochrome c oxidase subunit III